MSKFVAVIASSFCLFAASLSAQEAVEPVSSSEVVKNDAPESTDTAGTVQNNPTTTTTTSGETVANDDCGCGGKKKN